MNVGKYVISKMNDGCYVIEWLDTETRYKQTQRFADLEFIFDQLVKPRVLEQKKLADLFRLAFTHDDAFLNLPIAGKLLEKMVEPDITPGLLKDKYQRFIWHLKQFIDAYAQVTGIRLRNDEVEPYLNDMRDEF